MIVHILDKLNKKKIILASGSPRRKEILKQIGLQFEIEPSSFDEKTIDKKNFSTPSDFVKHSAQQKAIHVFKEKKDGTVDLVIGSDTVVILDGKILEKPTSEENAFEMLKSLSGREHTVCTGVALISTDFEIIFSNLTIVQFDEISDEIIRAYIKTKEPMDKAGSYGIQGIGGSFVKKIDGCYYNVMGFPLQMFCKKLLEIFDDKRKLN
eukprot:gene9201-1287_t